MQRFLYQIQDETKLRAEKIMAERGDWPCRQGCSDCCRRIASEPRVSEEEWRQIAEAIQQLPADVGAAARQRIRDAKGTAWPVTCPLLDSASGSCLVYEARPLACRAYGFYAERHQVLGCRQIESISLEEAEIVWGNHAALGSKLKQLGPAKEFSVWLQAQEGEA
ncbi:MAG: YkgJ family cysteine cluster protein [Bryobacteraceae bacterium]